MYIFKGQFGSSSLSLPFLGLSLSPEISLVFSNLLPYILQRICKSFVTSLLSTVVSGSPLHLH